jgi:tRNA pseudouridine38-40 synthase
MARFRIDITYDGTGYSGWQVQPNGVTVQEKIEGALNRLTSEKVKIHGSGRTDQGVHARRQVAHFDLAADLAPQDLLKAVNALLPPDIRLLKAERVPADFHARRQAKEKEYRYFIWNDEMMPPFYRHYRMHVRRRLDVSAMQKASGYLIGEHDFAAFTANPNRVIESTVRNLFALRVMKHGSEIVIVAKGEGFLYRMVRSLAGFLIRVGEGALAPEEAKTILLSKVRTARVPTAHPQGLFLWNVTY